MHHQAVELRRKREFGRARAVYRDILATLEQGEGQLAGEVEQACVVAHTWLNLALTEKALHNMDGARCAFREGVASAQASLRSDHGAWTDRRSRLRFRAGSDGQASAAALGQAFKWLATLLTSWALLESACGHTRAARSLLERATSFDKSKAPVLSWSVVGAEPMHA